MVRTITALRLQGIAVEEAIIQGAVRCLRLILIALILLSSAWSRRR